jgi:DNA repair protein RecO (recombination protein O)
MAISVVRGLILRETKVGDADKILTLLVKDVGKISVSAKGARRTKGNLSSGTSLFTYADFTIQTGIKHNFLSQVDIIDSFYALTTDLVTLSYASYFVELADKTTSEDIPANETLFLTINILKRLADKRLSPLLAAPIFELKQLQYNGFMPYTDNCVNCGKPHDNIIFPVGTLCRSCAKNVVNAAKVTYTNETLIYTIRYILSNEPPQLLDFYIDNDMLKQLADITSDMIDAHWGIALKTKKFINSLNMT